MYLHIGDNQLVDPKDVIGIFDLKMLKQNKEFVSFLDSIKIINPLKLKDAKTLILVNQQNNIQAYYTNISSNTLVKREF